MFFRKKTKPKKPDALYCGCHNPLPWRAKGFRTVSPEGMSEWRDPQRFGASSRLHRWLYVELVALDLCGPEAVDWGENGPPPGI